MGSTPTVKSIPFTFCLKCFICHFDVNKHFRYNRHLTLSLPNWNSLLTSPFRWLLVPTNHDSPLWFNPFLSTQPLTLKFIHSPISVGNPSQFRTTIDGRRMAWILESGKKWQFSPKENEKRILTLNEGFKTLNRYLRLPHSRKMLLIVRANHIQRNYKHWDGKHLQKALCKFQSKSKLYVFETCSKLYRN